VLTPKTSVAICTTPSTCYHHVECAKAVDRSTDNGITNLLEDWDRFTDNRTLVDT